MGPMVRPTRAEGRPRPWPAPDRSGVTLAAGSAKSPEGCQNPDPSASSGRALGASRDALLLGLPRLRLPAEAADRNNRPAQIKDIELIVLRHQLDVLRCQVERSKLRSSD